jgi:chaperonin GroES
MTFPSIFVVVIVLCSAQRVVNGFASRHSIITSIPSTTTVICQATKLDGRKIEGSVQPLNNFLLVRKAPLLEETVGGILLTGKAKIVKTEGKVISVGPGRTHPDSGLVFEMPVAPGDGVVYGKYDGTEVDIDGDKHTLIRDDDILVKYSGDELTLESIDVIRDSVLVFVDKSEEETEGGILLARTSKADSKPSTGEVVKVGRGRMASNGKLIAMDVAVGDMVKFRDFAGNEVEIEGKEYTVVKMADILAMY